MKVAVGSDLHLEFEAGQPLSAAPGRHPLQGPRLDTLHGVDLVLLAGDIWSGEDAVRYAAEVSDFLEVPVCLVAGNHEFYNRDIVMAREGMARVAADHGNVSFLDPGMAEFEIDGQAVRVLGATLWTDFFLFHEAWRAEAMFVAARSMNDFQIVQNGLAGVFSPADAVAEHYAQRTWLEEQLALPFDGVTIIMTHHAPSMRSVPDRFKEDLISAAFASDLEDLVLSSCSALWIHGHTHDRFDYEIGETRILCDPRGYVGHEEPQASAYAFTVVELG